MLATEVPHRRRWTQNYRGIASYTIATTSFDGYRETDGPFPAQLAAFTSTAQTSRLGADGRYTFAPGTWLWGTGCVGATR